MSGAMHKLENSGMFATEVEIMGLWDAGADLDEIAKRTGKKSKYIQTIVRRYAGGGSNRAFNAMSARGSAALLSAIRRAHLQIRHTEALP